MPAGLGLRLGALAMSLALGLPLCAAAQSPDASCVLLARTGARFSQTPLVGFDPAAMPSPPPAAPPGADAALILCHRATILPEMTDYRVPAEAHLPLALTDERRTVVIDLVDGRLHFSLRKGQTSPEEDAELKSRLDQMQSAMQARGPATPR